MTHTSLDYALALPGALLLACCVTGVYVAGYLRRRIRPVVLKTVYQQIEGVAKLQQAFRNPVLDLLTKVTALTVSVEFYLLSLPPLVWLGGQAGAVAAMAICQCMAVSTYMTCVLKDILSCPRPTQLPTSPSPPPATDLVTAQTPKQTQLRLRATSGKEPPAPPPPPAPPLAAAAISPRAPGVAETGGSANVKSLEVIGDAYRGEVEMGAPSMHTWCALIMPAYTAVVAQQMGVLSPRQGGAVAVGTSIWAAWVALSRLYLGVHTPVDLVLGAAGGTAMLGLWRLVGLAQMAACGPQSAAAAVQGMQPVPGWAAGAVAAMAEAGERGGGMGLVALGVVATMYVLALATYPMPLSHTTSYEYAVIFLGAALGGLTSTNSDASLLGRLLAPGATPHSPDLLASGSPGATPLGSPPIWAGAVPPVLRHPAAVVLMGFVSVAVVKEASKALLLALLPRLLDLAPPGLRRLWQPPVHPEGCWKPQPAHVDAVAVVKPLGATEAGAAADGESSCAVRNGFGGGKGGLEGAGAVGKGSGGGFRSRHGPARGPGPLMKTAKLSYDVDFLRKFLNYGLTVYAVVEFRHVASALLLQTPTMPNGQWVL